MKIRIFGDFGCIGAMRTRRVFLWLPRIFIDYNEGQRYLLWLETVEVEEVYLEKQGWKTMFWKRVDGKWKDA